MYGLIHKLKKGKKKRMKTIFKNNNKRVAYSIWLCPVLLLFI